MNGAPRQRWRPPCRPRRPRPGSGSRRPSRRRPRPAARRGSRTPRARRASRGRPCALAPKRKFSPTETRSAPSRSTSTRSMKLLGRQLGRTPRRRGSRPAPATPSPSITSRLMVERHDQLRQRRGMQDLERVRVEGEHGVGVVDHRRWPRWTPSKVPIATWRGARLGVGQRGDLDLAHRPPTSAAPPLRAGTRAPRPGSQVELARRRPRRERADRGAPQLRAVGVAEGLDQGADVGARPSTRSRSGRARRRSRAAPRGRRRPRARGSPRPRRGGPCGRGARRRPAPPRSSAGAGGPGRWAARASRGTRPVSVSSPSGSPVLERQPSRAVAR